MAGIYIHIPFCTTRCIYCDFYSTTLIHLKERYVQALCKELESRTGYLKGEPVETIYFGGGTPSLLRPEDFGQIFDTLHRHYNLKECREITLEANPDDMTESYAAMLAGLPFNRISMGVQTFQEETLKKLRRRHSARQAVEAVENCRKAGFDNISIDLIYGLPDETIGQWQYDLEQAIRLEVEHISAYHLIYEEGTPLYDMLHKGSIRETDEERSLEFFSMLIERLKAAGYEQYEISNFSKPGYRSRHNSSYWREIPYLGCGPSAHSYDKTSREWNIASLKQYIEGMEQGNRPYETELLDQNTRYNERVITSIRTCEGLDLQSLRQDFGEETYRYCMEMAEPHLNHKKLEITPDKRLRLTPEGIFISDGIMSDLLIIDN